MPVHNCSTLQGVTWFSNLKSILYGAPSDDTRHMEYLCIVATNTLRVKAIWNDQNKGYVLITSNRRKGGKWFTIMTITNGHPKTTTFVPTIIVTVEATTEVPTTEVPTTDVPTTEVPTTEVPTTEVPTTEVPTTEVPTITEAPTTEAPTITEVPTMEEPTRAVGVGSEPIHGEKVDSAKSNTETTAAVAENGQTVVIVLLGSFGILVVIVMVLITLRKPNPKKGDSADIYDFEVIKSTNEIDISEDTKEKDQLILRRLGKGASETFDANL